MEGRSCPCAFDNNGRFLALLTPDGRLKVWDCTNGSLRHQYTPSSHLSTSCTCLKWTSSSRDSETPRSKKRKTSHHSSPSEHGDIIALGTTSGDILLYSLSAGEIQQRLQGGHNERVNDLGWNKNGDLYSCSNDKHIVEWCTKNAEKKSKWKADRHSVSTIRVSPLGNCLLSAGRSIKLWDLDTKQVLKKFTGHASPVTELLFLPNPTTPDSNGNHVSDSAINGFYFLSGAQEDRLLNVWYIDLESKDKNSLVSLSLTDEPVSIDVTRHDSMEKPVHVSVITKDGQLHIFEQSLNGGGKKPVIPTRSIQLATSAGKQSTPSPVAFLCAKLKADNDPSVVVAYGSTVKPQFETMQYSTMERHTCLTRENTSSLPINGECQPLGPVDKSEKTMGGVTTLGPASMVLPRPTVATEALQGASAKNERQEKSLEDRLQAMNEERLSKQKGRVFVKDLPSASSMIQMLTQALHSQDNQLLEDVLKCGVKGGLIRNTVRRLPVDLVVPFISELVFKIQLSPNRGIQLSVWLRYLLSMHMSYLMTIPNLVESFSSLYTMMETRVGVFGKLCKLQGRLDLILSQVASQSQSATGEEALGEPLAYYQEEDSDTDDVHVEDDLALEGEQSESDDKWEEDLNEDEEMSSEGEEELDEDDDNRIAEDDDDDDDDVGDDNDG